MFRYIAVSILLVAIVAAQSNGCGSAPSNNHFQPTNCSAVNTCRQTHCTCTGGTWNANTLACNWATSTCTTVNTCQMSLVTCLKAAAEMTTGDCTTWGAGVLTALQGAAAGSSSTSISQLTASCEYYQCLYANSTRVSSCAVGTTCSAFFNPTTAAPGISTGASSVAVLGAVVVAAVAYLF